jgi:hypothetical protein
LREFIDESNKSRSLSGVFTAAFLCIAYTLPLRADPNAIFETRRRGKVTPSPRTKLLHFLSIATIHLLNFYFIEVIMKEQIFSLMLSVVIFATSPLFAMNDDDKTQGRGTPCKFNGDTSSAVLEQLPDEESRRIVCATAKDIYKKINGNWNYGTFFSTSVSSKLWEVSFLQDCQEVGGTKQVGARPMLIWKNKVSTFSAALEDLINNPAQLECANASKIVTLFCLKALMGEEVFNPFVADVYDVLESRGISKTFDFVNEFTDIYMKRCTGKAIPGSFLYISNVPHYSYFKPDGNVRGDNLCCVGEDQYLGFGPFYTGPQSFATIRMEHFNAFCNTSDVTIPYAHKVACEYFKRPAGDGRNQFEEMHRENQKKYDQFYVFDMQEIKAIKVKYQ